jgi:thiamine-phosphate pyrophosphorylase
MKRGIEKFQLLTHDIDGYSHEQQALDACMAGVRWIQLRSKKMKHDDLVTTAKEVKRMSVIFNVTFIVNDNVDVAQEANADGVHVGRTDTPVNDARKRLGDKFIIGTSSNTFGDIEEALKNGADYSGLGPYRYTATRQNLNPLLGLDGVRDVMKQYIIQGCKLPVIAIGGVRVKDVPYLMQTGIHGVAVSSAVYEAEDRKAAVQEFLTQIREANEKRAA